MVSLEHYLAVRASDNDLHHIFRQFFCTSKSYKDVALSEETDACIAQITSGLDRYFEIRGELFTPTEETSHSLVQYAVYAPLGVSLKCVIHSFFRNRGLANKSNSHTRTYIESTMQAYKISQDMRLARHLDKYLFDVEHL